MNPHLAEALRSHGIPVSPDAAAATVGGGDISVAWRVQTGNGTVFVKTGASEASDMFAAEAAGLEELRNADAIRIPTVLACGSAGSDGFLALEWIEFDQPQHSTERLFGQQLAALHRYTDERFGWHRDNTIGRTPQHNEQGSDWIEFFRRQRLLFQLQLAASNGFSRELQTEGGKLIENLERLFDGYVPVVSLLHGDLWGGNWASCGGEPVIFDPAVYYGDRESDIAMTRLFGGFGAGFYDAYNESWPLAEGHEQRQLLYQLYHVLNHLNLFGGSYLGRSMELLKTLNRVAQAS